MKANANRVRRLNQQLDVWRSHSPSYISEVEERMRSQSSVNVSKDGQRLIFSARNMTPEEYQQQEEIMKYFEKNIGTYTEFEKRITKQIEEETGQEVKTQEEVDRFIDVLANYDELIGELFKNAKTSGLAKGYLDHAEDEIMSLQERVDFLEGALNSGVPYDPMILEKAIESSEGFD